MRISQIIALLWLALPLVTWGGNHLLKRQRLPFWHLLLATGFIGYILLLTSSRLSGSELKAVLDSYDLNGDGTFTGAEITPQMRGAMQAFTSDTGRALAPFTAGPITLLWTLIVFGVCNLLRRCQRALFRKTGSAPPSSLNPTPCAASPTDAEPGVGNSHVGRFICYCASLVLIAAGCAALFACLSVGKVLLFPIITLLFGVIAVVYLWPMVLALGVWNTWFPPRGRLAWLLLGFAACAAGGVASWRFQVIGPFDFYHKADGSMPGRESVQMASLTTVISCISAITGATFSSLIIQRRMGIRDNAGQACSGQAAAAPDSNPNDW